MKDIKELRDYLSRNYAIIDQFNMEQKVQMINIIAKLTTPDADGNFPKLPSDDQVRIFMKFFAVMMVEHIVKDTEDYYDE